MASLQLYLNSISTREEVIFLIRILMHQIQERQLCNIKQICDEIMKGESRREEIETKAINTMNESVRKILNKIVKKAQNVHAYYLHKTQTYFPKYGQYLQQEYINSYLKNINLNHDTHLVLKQVTYQQKQKLKQELLKLYQTSQFDISERCNRNEKMFSDPLIIGTSGARYLNQLHSKFYYQNGSKSQRNVYDLLQLDDNSKTLYYNGAGKNHHITHSPIGCRNFLSIANKFDKQLEQSTSVYVPIESTQEIITQRYEKFMKELLQNNLHVSRSLEEYQKSHSKYIHNKPKPLSDTPTHNIIKITKHTKSQQFRPLEQIRQKTQLPSFSQITKTAETSETEMRNSASSLPGARYITQVKKLVQLKFQTQKFTDISLGRQNELLAPLIKELADKFALKGKSIPQQKRVTCLSYQQASTSQSQLAPIQQYEFLLWQKPLPMIQSFKYPNSVPNGQTNR